MRLYQLQSLLFTILSYQSTFFVNALFEEEAGEADFTLSTAGLGRNGIGFARLTSDENAIITSSRYDSISTAEDGDDKGCYISSRNTMNGTINWRRNACGAQTNQHAILYDPTNDDLYGNNIYTLDSSGLVRVWDEREGVLLTETSIHGVDEDEHSSDSPKLFDFGSCGGDDDTDSCIGAVLSKENVGDALTVLYKKDLSSTGISISAKDLLSKVKSKEGSATPKILAVGSTVGDKVKDIIAVGYTSIDESTGLEITSFQQMAVVSINKKDNMKPYEFNNLNRHGEDDIIVSSIKLDGNDLSAITTNSPQEVYIYSIIKLKAAKVVVEEWTNQVEESLPTIVSNNIGIVQCGKSTISFSTKSGEDMISIVTPTETKSLVGIFRNIFTLSCSNDEELKTLVTTQSGTTYALEISSKTSDGSINQMWTTEEALGSISSAIFLDATQPIISDEKSSDVNDEDEATFFSNLSFQARLESQVNSVKDFLINAITDPVNTFFQGSSSDGLQTKKYSFGIAKVAVLLSNPFSKIMGIDTSSDGSILWSINLNPQATWHKIIHGSSSSHSSVFGHGHHHPHSHEILVLSHLSDGFEWYCMDGLRGRVFSKANVAVSSPIVQVIPVHGYSHGEGSCRQNAILLHEDDTISFVPDTPQTRTELSNALTEGIYTHKVEKETGLFRSMHINMNSNQVITVGETVFNPASEKIINVAYPERNEVIQSPITMLGDDSLLLKYFNPHACVVVTEATSDLISSVNESDIFKALEADSAQKKKKPLGATKPGESTPSTDEKRIAPSLFINVVDTVSGQILYRVSHSHASADDITAQLSTNVPVVISENWIIYAFPNYKTRRTEVGVMTLYEGMIDKHGISAFKTPEQETKFSSMTSPKPIALTKTYGVSKPVTALGVTNTKNGISSKSLLVATGASGQIIRIDRRMLDTRRPSGEPTKSEKKEGLMQYAPLLPISSMWTPSYTNTVVDATSIISTAANLESQTLILAFGGPDIFFARFAPSKGFDILPESFNKPLLMLVVSAFVVVLNIFRRKSQSKLVQLGWS